MDDDVDEVMDDDEDADVDWFFLLLFYFKIIIFVKYFELFWI